MFQAHALAPFALWLVLGWLASCGGGGERGEAVVQIDLRDSVLALGSDDLETADAAEDRLAAIGAPALPVLAAALRHEQEPVRIGVIAVLNSMEGVDVVPLLALAAADSSEIVRADTATALRGQRGPAVEETLGRLLADPSETVRHRAAIACANACRSAERVRGLVALALDDPAPGVGWVSVAGLVRIEAAGDPALVRSIGDVVRADAPERLQSGSPSQRARAAVLLAAVGDARGVPVLTTVAADPADPRVRLKAIYALGRVGGPDTVPVLRGLLGQPGVSLYPYDALRQMAERKVAGADAALAAYDGPRPSGPLPPP